MCNKCLVKTDYLFSKMFVCMTALNEQPAVYNPLRTHPTCGGVVLWTSLSQYVHRTELAKLVDLPASMFGNK